MPQININEIDKTQYGLTGVYDNNIVYCPINSSIGTYEPTLITSYDQFVKTYGESNVDPETKMTAMTSYDYAKGILLSGFPILCKRIEMQNGIATATCEIAIGPATMKLFEVAARTHGTFLNSKRISCTILARNTSKPTAIKITIFNDDNSDVSLVSTYDSRIYYSTSNYVEDDNAACWSEIKSQLLDDEFNAFELIKVTQISKLYYPAEGHESRLKFQGGSDLGESTACDIILNAYSANSSDASYEKYLGFLNDKYLQDVKFITMGGYCVPVNANDSSTISVPEKWKGSNNGIIRLCESRQDCFGLIDIPYGLDKNAVLNQIRSASFDTTYAAAYAPWTYEKLYDGSYAWVPPSYTFLTNLAQSVKNTPIYYPPAGVNRMKCRRTVKPEYEIGASILRQWQNDDSLSINPIMYIRGFGYTIYGQRTLTNNTAPIIKSSLESVTVRFCSIEIKKAIFNACISLTFEQNILRTWNEFKSIVETTLLEMKKNGGLNSYMIIMDRSTISETDLNNNIARGIVRAAINDALENFEIAFEISPSYVNFDDETQSIEISNDIQGLS